MGGSFIFSLIYFIIKKEWKRENIGLLDQSSKEDQKLQRKVLLMTWNNTFDWWCLGICSFAAALEILIFFTIIWVFKVAHSAQMNIGICVGIWAIFPFMVAVWERV